MKSFAQKEVEEAQRDLAITEAIVNNLPRLVIDPKVVYTHSGLGAQGGLGFDASLAEVGRLMSALSPVPLVAAKQTGYAGSLYLPEYLANKKTDLKEPCAPWSISLNQHTGADVDWYTMIGGEIRHIKAYLKDGNSRFRLRIDADRDMLGRIIRVKRYWCEFHNPAVKAITHEFRSASGSHDAPGGLELWWSPGVTWQQVIA